MTFLSKLKRINRCIWLFIQIQRKKMVKTKSLRMLFFFRVIFNPKPFFILFFVVVIFVFRLEIMESVKTSELRVCQHEFDYNINFN